MPSSYTNPTPGQQPAKASLPGEEDLRADADAVISEARNLAANVAGEATDQAQHLAEQAKAQVAEVAEKAKGMAAQQKDMIAGHLGGVADAVERVASDLEGEAAPAAGYARTIADSARKIASVVEDNDVDDIMTKAQDFGRRQPVAFLGAAALLGFAASRFVTASARRQQERSMSMSDTSGTSSTMEPASTLGSGSMSGQASGQGGYDGAR